VNGKGVPMLSLRHRVVIEGVLSCKTALHVGSGEEGVAAADKGVMKSGDGVPFVPGSSLKGVFRSTAERLAEFVGMTACLLEPHAQCVTADQKKGEAARKQIKDATGAAVDGLVAANACDICRFFGGPLAAGRISFTDAVIDPASWPGRVEVRDGVGLDRDSRTAVERIKFNFEVVPAGARFRIRIVAENATNQERALLWAVLLEWSRGFKLGGMTSRGLGDVVLEDVKAQEYDLTTVAGRRALVLGDPGKTIDEASMRAAVASAVVGN